MPLGLANQFDGSFLIGFVRKTPELSRLSRPERQQFLAALDDGAFTAARSNFVRRGPPVPQPMTLRSLLFGCAGGALDNSIHRFFSPPDQSAQALGTER